MEKAFAAIAGNPWSVCRQDAAWASVPRMSLELFGEVVDQMVDSTDRLEPHATER